MITQHIRFSIRALRRRPFLSLINLIGLTLAVTVVLMIYQYQRHEWSYDRFLDHPDRLFRVDRYTSSVEYGNHQSTGVSAYLMDAVDGQIPAIEHMVRISSGTARAIVGNESFSLEGQFVGPAFFDMFSFPLLQGDPHAILDSPSSAVLTVSTAEKLFGTTDVVGKQLTFELAEGETQAQVTGVMEDFPSNSVFYGEVLLPFSLSRNMRKRMEENNGWGMTYSQTFVQIAEGADPEIVEADMHRLLAGIGETEDHTTTISYPLQPLTTLYMTASNPRNYPTRQSPTGSFILQGIALLILLIACLNYTSLSLASALTRSKEVGIRKVLGSSMSGLRSQFLIETAVLSFAAIVLGLILTEVLLPYVSQFVDKELTFQFDWNDGFFLLFFGGLLILLAGFYPAVMLSHFPVISSLKKLSHLGGRSTIRRVLVSFQLAVSIALIGLTLVMRNQMHYIFASDLGIKGENVIQVDMLNQDYSAVRAVGLLRDALAGDPGIVSIAGASNRFGGSPIWFGWTDEDGTIYEKFRVDHVTTDFIKTMGIQLVQGRDFDLDVSTDAQSAILVNEALVRELGWDNPIGQRLPGKFREHHVIGVMKDFHYEDMHEEIHPLVVALNPGIVFSIPLQCGWEDFYTVQHILFRLRPDDIPGTLKRIRSAWLDLVPGHPWNPTFTDEDIDKLYQNDKQWAFTVQASSMIVIVIALLGLLGLSALQVEQKTREIGIRKVLGAGAGRLTALLTREFLLLTLISGAVAIPVALLLAKRWLEGYAYRIQLTGLEMLIGLLMAVGLSLLCTGLLAWHAALRNPVETLRQE